MSKNSIKQLIKINISTLQKLYDEETGAFNQRIYVDFPLLDRTKYLKLYPKINFVVSYHDLVLTNIFKHSVYSLIKIENTKNLKYIGHACVGLAWYLKIIESTDKSLINILYSNIQFLAQHQSSFGNLKCSDIQNNGKKMTFDAKRIVEASNSFLWALALVHSLDIDNEIKSKKWTNNIDICIDWLFRHRNLLIPQEVGRFIYALSQIYCSTRNQKYLKFIKSLGELIIFQLAGLKSSRSFPDCIDSIGGLSVAQYLTKEKEFFNFSRQLAFNLLNNQGSKGEWRWAYDTRTGQWNRLFDLTYTVHQLGMGPWAFSLFIASSDYDKNISQRIMKGISWVSVKKGINNGFVTRCFSGLIEKPCKFEQFSYEPGLNLLGLLSFLLVEGLQSRNLPLIYTAFPQKMIDDLGFHPYSVINMHTHDLIREP